MNTTPASSRPDACVIYAGGLQASPLQALSPISVLDLMLTERATVLETLLARVAEACAGSGKSLPVTVVWGQPVPEPSMPTSLAGLDVRVTREASAWRGSAGVLADVCKPFASDATILVLEGARWLAVPLLPMLEAHARRDAHITVARNPDATPAGAYLVRRSTLDAVPQLGYLDLKEQFMGKFTGTPRGVHVHALPHPGAAPLRTLEDFLAAARAASGAGNAPGASVRSAQAAIAPDATVANSVVMAEARIESGAVVARSIVLKGAVVSQGTEIVDAVVAPGSLRVLAGSAT